MIKVKVNMSKRKIKTKAKGTETEVMIETAYAAARCIRNIAKTADQYNKMRDSAVVILSNMQFLEDEEKGISLVEGDYGLDL